MLEPGHDRARRGRLRASHADRDQVVDTLKDAFVQGRLTKDEFDARISGALTSRTLADLAALRADLPDLPPATWPPAARPGPERKPVPVNATVKKGTRVIAATTLLTGGVWTGALVSQADSPALAMLVWAFTFLWVGIVILVVSVMLDARLQKRSGLNPS